MSSLPVLSARELRVELARGGQPIVEDITLEVATGEILGIVGESGSGKTTTAMALLGYCTEGTRIVDGAVTINGQSILGQAEHELRRLRGRVISYVPQNPGVALNPAIRIGNAISEVIELHRGSAPDDGVAKALHTVQLPTDPEFQRRYPHQLSGGQQQRLCIGIAMSCEPAVVVFDEPTTGLDVVTQAHVLEEVCRLRDELSVSMVYVSHDLSVVAQVANRVAVMYAGAIVEEGPAAAILSRPSHPYTRGLLASIPDHVTDRAIIPIPGLPVGVGERPHGCAFAPRCDLAVERCIARRPSLDEIRGGRHVRCFRWEESAALAGFRREEAPLRCRGGRMILRDPDQPALLEVSHLRAEHQGRGRRVVAAADVTFQLDAGRSLAIVGASGSGKTTIARTIAGLHPLTGGEIRLHGELLPRTARKRSQAELRAVQVISQNPTDALNPRETIKQTIERGIWASSHGSSGRPQASFAELLELVRLPTRLAERYPRELSGGERQRVAIARALAVGPEVLICDEITSALDVSVQAAVLRLLRDLLKDFDIGILFITHDLGVVAEIADYVLVLNEGFLCEEGEVSSVLQTPQSDYARRLIGAAPSITAAIAQFDVD